MGDRNKGGRPPLKEPLSEMVPVRFTKRQLAALDEVLSGMGMDRSAGVRALALTALSGGRGVVGGELCREERSRVAPVPQTVFRPLPPGTEPDPEFAEDAL